MRTARSRNSREYFDDFLFGFSITPFSQELEPPKIPGRFKSPRAGFWKCYQRLRREGYAFSHKRIYRVYCRMGLNLRRRVQRVLPKRIAKPLEVSLLPNQQWALDFMHDALYCGKRFRTLNIIDKGARECLALCLIKWEVDRQIKMKKIYRLFRQFCKVLFQNSLYFQYGYLPIIKVPIGPIFA